MNNSPSILSEKIGKTQQILSEKEYKFQNKIYKVSDLKKLTYTELVSLMQTVTEVYAEINREKTRLIESNPDLKSPVLTLKLHRLNNQKTKYSEFNTVVSRIITEKKVKVIDDFFYILYQQFKRNVNPETFWKCVSNSNKIVPLPKDVKQRLDIRDSYLEKGE